MGSSILIKSTMPQATASSPKESKREAEEELRMGFGDLERNRQSIGLSSEDVAASAKETKAALDSLKKDVSVKAERLNSAFWLMDLLGWVMPVSIGVFYFVTLAYFGLPASFYIEGFAIVISLMFLLRLVVWTTRFRMSGQDVSFAGSLRDSLKGFMGSKFKLGLRSDKIERAASDMGASTSKLLLALTPYVPGLEKYYKGQYLVRSQDAFVTSLRNSLLEYGITVEGKAASYLSDFHSTSDSDIRWLEKACSDLSVILDIPPPILKFVYADYTNDEAEKKNQWTSVKGATKTFNKFIEVLLDGGVLPGEYSERNLGVYGGIESLVLKLNPFSLAAFAKAYSIQYYEYAGEKDSLLDAARTYRLRVSPTTEKEIKKLIPPSFDEVERRRYLFDMAAPTLGASWGLLSLFFYERESISDRRKAAWTDVKESEVAQDSPTLDAGETGDAQEPPAQVRETEAKEPGLLTELANILHDGGHIAFPSIYPSKEALVYSVAVLKSLDDFSLASGISAVRAAFAGLQVEKDTLIRTLSRFNIDLDEGDRLEFMSTLPEAEAPAVLAGKLAEFAKVPSQIITLLYLDFTAQGRRRDDYFTDQRQSEDGPVFKALLAKELLARKLVFGGREGSSVDENTANLAEYLSVAHGFDLAAIDSTFSKYSKLYEYSKHALSFLIGQGVCRPDAKTGFGYLIERFPRPSDDFLEDFRATVQLFLSEFGASGLVAGDWARPASFAFAVVFFVQRDDVSVSDVACRRAANNDRAVKILYEYSWVNEDEQYRSETDRTRLSGVLRKAIDGLNTRTAYLPEFRRGLVLGHLFRRVSEIPLTRLQHIEDGVSAVASQMEFDEKLQEHLTALETFLTSRLQSPVIMESLRMQLVTVYAVTVPTGADVLTGLFEKHIPTACSDLAENDSGFKELVIKEEATEPAAGRFTRLGVVPFRMQFNDFAARLRIAYRTAFERYKESGPLKHPIDDYVANVIRIFPTDEYFKQLAPLEVQREPEEFLSDLIRPIMVLKFGQIRTAEILASLNTIDEDQVAMRGIMAKLYDTVGSLYLIAKERFNTAISSPKLREHFESGGMDKDLADAFEKNGLSDLALAVYRSAKYSVEEQATTREKVSNSVTKICKGLKTQDFAEGEIENVSRVTFECLNDIGMILSGLVF